MAPRPRPRAAPPAPPTPPTPPIGEPERYGLSFVGRAEAVFVSGDLDHWLRPRFGRFCTALE